MIRSRDELRQIKGIGPKSFQQAAGFLRIYNGDEKLDATWIHPESYPIAKKLLKSLKSTTSDIGTQKLKKISEANFEKILTKNISTENVEMIKSAFELKEDDLRKGRDITFRKHLIELRNLKIGETVLGQVMNTTSFGSFVDIGLGQGWKSFAFQYEFRGVFPNFCTKKNMRKNFLKLFSKMCQTEK